MNAHNLTADMITVHALKIRIGTLDSAGRVIRRRMLQNRLDVLCEFLRNRIDMILEPYGVTLGQLEGAEL